MTFDIVPGNALGCRTNAHRHGWDGSICEDAADWACGIESDFRTKYCQAGTPRCFHLHLFDEDDPHLIIPDSGVGWLLGKHPEAFDEQVLLIWAPQAEEPHGMVGGRPVGSYMAGAYRIESAERIEQRNHIEWKIHPYDDGWAYMGSLETQAPRFIHLGGPYIKQVDRAAIGTLFESAMKSATEVTEYWTQEEKERLEHFAGHVDEWLSGAEERVVALMGDSRPGVTKEPKQSESSVEAPEPEPELAQRLIPLPPKAPSVEPPDSFPMIDESRRERIEQIYGTRTLRSLQVAAMTHPLVLLTGHAGVGKSTLALEFIDDPQRERSLVVPVGANWASPEHLFGTLNKSTGIFEPTRFTNFMRAAELAWLAGDFETRVVVFENFDLCPPEDWLSEIRIRLQYPATSTRDRTIDFGGKAVRGWAPGAEPRLFLSPTVRFVATVDEPLRPESLTARLLDDVGIVELTISTADALRLSGASLTTKQIEGLVALDRCTRPFLAGINLTTANSISNCLERIKELGVDNWKTLDLVLCQEILSKMELLKIDGLSEEHGHELINWSEGPGKKFIRTAARLAELGERASRVGVYEV
jgi:hypothetical protein